MPPRTRRAHGLRRHQPSRSLRAPAPGLRRSSRAKSCQRHRGRVHRFHRECLRQPPRSRAAGRDPRLRQAAQSLQPPVHHVQEEPCRSRGRLPGLLPARRLLPLDPHAPAGHAGPEHPRAPALDARRQRHVQAARGLEVRQVTAKTFSLYVS